MFHCIIIKLFSEESQSEKGFLALAHQKSASFDSLEMRDSVAVLLGAERSEEPLDRLDTVDPLVDVEPLEAEGREPIYRHRSG